MKFIKHHMASIEGVSLYPIISLIICFTFFIVLFWWVLSYKKKDLNEISNLPFNDDDQKQQHFMRNLLALIRILIIVGFAALLLEYSIWNRRSICYCFYSSYPSIFRVPHLDTHCYWDDPLPLWGYSWPPAHRLSKTTKRACRAKQLVGALCSLRCLTKNL